MQPNQSRRTSQMTNSLNTKTDISFGVLSRSYLFWHASTHTHNSLTPGGRTERATITNLPVHACLGIRRVSLEPIHQSYSVFDISASNLMAGPWGLVFISRQAWRCFFKCSSSYPRQLKRVYHLCPKVLGLVGVTYSICIRWQYYVVSSRLVVMTGRTEARAISKFSVKL